MYREDQKTRNTVNIWWEKIVIYQAKEDYNLTLITPEPTNPTTPTTPHFNITDDIIKVKAPGSGELLGVDNYLQYILFTQIAFVYIKCSY